MSVQLRPFQPADLQQLEAWAARIQSHDFMSRFRPNVPRATAHDPSNGLLWFVITEADSDVGSVWIEPGATDGESVLGILIGDRTRFGQGIGGAALRLAISEFQKAFPNRSLSLNVRESNARAIACYKRAGFSIVGSGSKVTPSGEPNPYFRMRL